jgi:hypothetical protein
MTNDGQVPCGVSNASPDVWYSFAPTIAGRLIVDTSGSAIDTVLSVHSACPGTVANAIACNDDTQGTRQSRVEIHVQPGLTYYIRFAANAGGAGFITVHTGFEEPTDPPRSGPDVIVGDIPDTVYYATENSISSFAVGTTSCNIGDAPATWIGDTNQHPIIAGNMYRLKNGLFMQVGQSWVKHGFATINGDVCSTCVLPPNSGAQLGVNCSDPYVAILNGDQAGLGPRSLVNPTTGAFPYPFSAPAYSGQIMRRLQVRTADIDPAQNSGAIYWVEGQYVTADDALAGNGLNNVSSRRIAFVGTNRTPQFVGATARRRPAIRAWTDADPAVDLAQADYPENALAARFNIAARVHSRGGGVWQYVYAIHNMNSNRACASFSVPLPPQVSPSAIGFHDVDAHSGEPYSTADWTSLSTNDSLTWRTESFGDNANANALRWGTTYTFWFNANTPPRTAEATLGLFLPGTPDSIRVQLPVPGFFCPADLDDGSGTGTRDGGVSVEDLLSFLDAYIGGQIRADLDDGTGSGTPDGGVTIDDLRFFLDHLAAGC